MEMGVVSPSNSPYNVSLSVAVKSNGSFRFTLNLILVNE